ncbi:MAG: endolytic transglycosylase MltG [Bullifex sp.]
MSENSFKVPAKTPRPVKQAEEKADVKKKAAAERKTPSPAGKNGSRKKNDAPAANKELSGNTSSHAKPAGPKKLKGSDLSFSKQELPSLPSLANMTRDERIAALSGEKKKKSSSDGKPGKSERSEITQIRESVRKQKPAGKREPVEVHEAPPVKKDRSVFLTLAFVILVFILIILIVVLLKRRTTGEQDTVTQLIPNEASVFLSISSGMGASQVAGQIPEGEREAFLSFLDENGLASSIQTGEFSFPAGTGGGEIARIITYKEKLRTFTVYAGYTLSDIDQALSNRGFAAPGEFLKAAGEYGLQHGLSFTEGYFLAGNYTFRGIQELLDEMHEGLLDVLRSNAEAVMESGRSVDDIVKTASIINRESQDSEQLRIIARIVLNRLDVGMPIGVDATTRYETGNWTSPIARSTYEKDTPYNTRRKPGLPPSGIGCPGEDALLAVLFPASTDDLYYLHDREGKLYTSASYEEHLLTYEKVHQI